MTTPITYRLQASNPGQFYYDVFYSGSGNTTLVFRAVFKADHMMGAKGPPFPSMVSGGEGEVMMPAGIGYEVIAFDNHSVNTGAITKFLGEGVKYVG